MSNMMVAVLLALLMPPQAGGPSIGRSDCAQCAMQEQGNVCPCAGRWHSNVNTRCLTTCSDSFSEVCLCESLSFSRCTSSRVCCDTRVSDSAVLLATQEWAYCCGAECTQCRAIHKEDLLLADIFVILCSRSLCLSRQCSPCGHGSSMHVQHAM
jgi:hypothetical protein